jgi:Tol biopolymer transport system component
MTHRLFIYGTRIAFSSSRSGTENLYVMNADGTNQTRLIVNAMWDSKPVWSPDGLKIAFRGMARDNNSDEIYTVNANGTNPIRITNNTSWDQGHTWQPL